MQANSPLRKYVRYGTDTISSLEPRTPIQMGKNPIKSKTMPPNAILLSMQRAQGVLVFFEFVLEFLDFWIVITALWNREVGEMIAANTIAGGRGGRIEMKDGWRLPSFFFYYCVQTLLFFFLREISVVPKSLGNNEWREKHQRASVEHVV